MYLTIKNMTRKTYSVEKFSEFGYVIPPACTGHLKIIKKYNYAEVFNYIEGFSSDNC